MGRTPCCQKDGLKKGPWTPEEDQKLIGFINQHGHGNWRALPKKCGLLRCGKSCRLRWINYLKPDIKRGCFSHSEEQKIIQLHALVGNKWAFIASQLSNRTDNEIKNYWNTVLRKRLQKRGSILFHEVASKSSSKCCSINVNTKFSMASISCSHLAQWESARLEAEARFAKESKIRSIASVNWPFGFNLSTSSSANQPSSIKSQINPHNQFGLSCLASKSQVSLIQDHMEHILLANRSTFSSSNINNISSGIVSSSCQSVDVGASAKSSLSSPNSITSTLKLSPNGRLSWKTPEPSLLESNDLIPNSLQSSSQSASANTLDQPHESEAANPQKPRVNTMINPIDDTMISLPLADPLHDLLFEVDNYSSSKLYLLRSGKNEASEVENATVLKNNHNSHDNNLDYYADCNNNNDSMKHSASQLVDNGILPSMLSHHYEVVSTAFDAVGFTEGLNFHPFDTFLCEKTAAQLNNLVRELFFDTPCARPITNTSSVD